MNDASVNRLLLRSIWFHLKGLGRIFSILTTTGKDDAELRKAVKERLEDLLEIVEKPFGSI